MIGRSLRLTCLGLFLHGSVVAQELTNTLEFSFSNPGARSMALGGAFVALADDATAAFANPAGLVQLTRPEISIEGRKWNYSIPFIEGGRLTGQPTGILLDDTPGLRTARSTSETSGISFVSFVYPRQRWAFAAYRHQLANFEQFGETQGLFADEELLLPGQAPRVPDLRTFGKLEIVNYGASVAYRVSDAWSLGLGVSYQTSELTLDSALYLVEDPTREESLFGLNPYLPERLAVSGLVDSKSSGWGLNLGVLGRLSSRWSCAAFFRRGPNFDIRSDILSGPGLVPTFPEGTVLDVDMSVFPLPDVFGLGVAFRPLGDLTLAFEWDRVQYSQIFVEDDTNTLDDGSELHLGVEYALIRTTPIIALRSGVWLDPDHQIRAEGNDLVERALFRGGDDEWHFTVGLGLAFDRFQVDFGADLSNLVDRFALSAIYNF